MWPERNVICPCSPRTRILAVLLWPTLSTAARPRVALQSQCLSPETAHAHAHALARLQGLFDKQDGGAVLPHSRLLLYNDRCTVAHGAPHRSREKAEGARMGSDKVRPAAGTTACGLIRSGNLSSISPNTISSLTQSGNASSRMPENKRSSSDTSKNKAGGGSLNATSLVRSRRAVLAPKRWKISPKSSSYA